MNDLPVIEYLRLRKEFLGHHGVTIVTRYKGTHDKRLF